MSPEPRGARFPLTHALALGALHGPAELLPVSSSAHVTLVPQILGWPYADLPPDVRKAFEVALHTGTLAGLVALVPLPRTTFALLATAPAAAVGYLLEGPIERRLGGARATAVGLVAGSALLLVADARGGRARRTQDAGARDALAIGAAQALALWPGLSRLGVAVAAARLRGFDRPDAFDLGRRAGLPIIAGATGLKAVRLARSGLAPELRRSFAAGAGAALAATVAAAPLCRRTGVRGPAAERVALAAAATAVAVRRRR